MENITPTRAYDLLDDNECHMVDEYVNYAINQQILKRERIINALNVPIPYEYIKKSNNSLYKPLLRASIAERIKEEAEKQDISPDKVIKKHAIIAFGDISDFIEPAGCGDFRVKDFNQIDPEKIGAIKSIETKPGMYGLHSKVVLHDPVYSLKVLGELMGLVPPDKPALLAEYVKPLESKELEEVDVEKAYMKLIEDKS